MLKRPMRVSLTIFGADMQPTTASHVTARLDAPKHRLGMVLHEQHRRDDDVGLAIDVEASLQGRGIVPLGGGMEGKIEPGNLDSQSVGARDRPRPPDGCPA